MSIQAVNTERTILMMQEAVTRQRLQSKSLKAATPPATPSR